MSYPRPTLPTLISRISEDIASRLPGTDPTLRRAVLNALAKAEANAANGLYGDIDWVSRQIIPDQADYDILVRYANWWGVPVLAATASTGNTIAISGTDGKPLPAGTLWRRSDGVQYSTDADATISGTTGTATVSSTTTGAATSLTVGQTLNLVSPVDGIQSTAPVTVVGVDGTDGDSAANPEPLRTRLRTQVQKRPQGGAVADYEDWALEVSGVTRVWVLPSWLGAGTVGIAFVRDNDTTGIIPDAAEVAAVQAYIDDPSRKPVTAAVTVFAPTEAAQALTIKLNPNTAAVQAAVQAELADLFLRESAVEDGTGSGTILLTHVRDAIGNASGVVDYALINLSADITLTKGEIATLGTLTWQAL